MSSNRAGTIKLGRMPQLMPAAIPLRNIYPELILLSRLFEMHLAAKEMLIAASKFEYISSWPMLPPGSNGVIATYIAPELTM